MGKKPYSVVVGFDVLCTIETEIEASNKEELVAKVKDVLDNNGGDETAEIVWDCSDNYRVLHVWDEDGQPRHEAKPKEALDDAELDAINNGDPVEQEGEPWLIDLPNVFGIGSEDDSWKHVKACKTKAEAVTWIRENVGDCDNDGNISLLTFCPDHQSA